MSRILRLPEVIQRVGISRATIQRAEKAGTFPARKILSHSCVGWFEKDIDMYIESLSSTPQKPRKVKTT